MKGLSIVVPTFNRANYLERIIENFQDDLKSYEQDVELIICNNASTDRTNEILNSVGNNYCNLKVFNHEKHLAVGLSIDRSIKLANKDYVLVWGDDDIPSPNLIGTLLKELYNNSKIGFIHFNRIEGYEFNEREIILSKILFKKLDSLKKQYQNIDDLLYDHYFNLTFISSIVFKKSYYTEQKDENYNRYQGYEFIYKILSGINNEKIFFLNFPLCIQNKPIHRYWNKKSAHYRLISLPTLLLDLKNNGKIQDFDKIWNKWNSLKNYLIILPHILYDKGYYFQNRKEIFRFQKSSIRKILFFLTLLIPVKFYEWLKKSFQIQVYEQFN